MGSIRYPGILCDVPGILVGHAQDFDAATGCTVVVSPEGAVGGCDVRGAAPGTRETDLLTPGNQVERIHAVLLSGGSAFGLDAAGGVMAELASRGIGFEAGMNRTRVPIVPGAVIFDLDVGRSDVRPDAAMGRMAARSASAGEDRQGSVGAGTGATIGKVAAALGLSAPPAKGGVGMASLTLPSGLIVAALVVVNALGDVVDPETGEIVACAASAGTRLSAMELLLSAPGSIPEGGNTTIGVVATNAILDKAGARRACVAAHDGLAMAVRPAHTLADGDAFFCMATCAVPANPVMLSAAAARVVARACVNAALAARP